MKIKKKIMRQLEDQASQIAYFDEDEKVILERLVYIYKAGVKSK
jgi:hypothetical protein